MPFSRFLSVRDIDDKTNKSSTALGSEYCNYLSNPIAVRCETVHTDVDGKVLLVAFPCVLNERI